MNKYFFKLQLFLSGLLPFALSGIDQNLQSVIDEYNSPNYQYSRAYLRAYDRSIKDLTGIEQLTSLTWLDLEENPFSDISPLTSLTNLQDLHIGWGGKITSLNGIQSLNNLTNLEVPGQKLSSISELANLNNLTKIYLVENYINLGDPTIQSQIKTLRDRGVSVSIDGQIPISIQDLSTQKSIRSTELKSNPDDPKANFIHGFELLLDLLEEESEGSLKSIAVYGGATSEINNFTLADSWRNDLDYDDSSAINTLANLDQLEDYVKYTFVPKLTEINTHLKKLADSTSIISLTQDLTGNEEVITADNGDALALMALVEAKKGLFQFLASYQWDSYLKGLDEKEKNDLINLETILDSSHNFMHLKYANQLSQSKESFKNAIKYYKQASEIMRSRIDTERLFKMESADVSDDDEFIADINQFLSALDNNHNLSDDGTEVDMINLNALFSGKVDLVNQSPAAVGDKFETDVVNDSTFGGLMPNWTPEILKAKMKEENLVSSDSMDGAVDVKGATNWKQSGWLGYFYIPNRTDPNNFWMYHMYLKWVYFYSSSPADIWLFRQTGKNSDGTLKGDWFWTKKSIFPNLFRQTDNAWFYLMPNGLGFKQWDNTSWIDADI